MLKGAMDALVVGDPLDLETDVGPIIDAEAQRAIYDYLDGQKQRDKLLYQIEVPSTGFFVGPCIIEVNGIEEIEKEVFGPVLHLARFESDQLGQVAQHINDKGYGLTFGLHTRIDKRVQELVNLVDVGNFYVNRNQIGAIVGSQPFGGEGLSGTGPKAGGPHYLRRFRQYINASTVAKSPPKLTADIENLSALCDSLNNMPVIPRAERVDQLRRLLRGRADLAMAAAAALDVGPVDLPGPTGEANQLSLHPIGTVLCLSEDPESLLDMVVQGLRAGNRVVACGNNTRRHLIDVLSEGGFPLVVIDGIPNPNQFGELNIDALAMDDTIDTREVKKFLAAETGPIVRVITERIYPAAYTVERSLCIDTTAAGGNAALLADSA
jgi:RHH-type proline utilization regulon transcriptional repressor/proline dehydrogenase/delta 1-pyrroline-5-carboxylate dehydrogenase